MAGTLKVGTITTPSGSGTITIPSGVTLSGGVANTPAFEATVGGSQGLSDNTDTKIQFPTESFDTDSCYDNSTNYRFTPTTSGKYFVYAGVRAGNATNSSIDVNSVWIKKNGTTTFNFMRNDFPTGSPKGSVIFTQAVVDMNGSTDYVEIYANYDMNSGTATVWNGFFGAYKIIGA